MNDQQAFDIVVTHLFTQKKPARDHNGSCKYKTDGGLMCAVGCLIPDDEYKEHFEGKTVVSIYEQLPFLRSVSIELLARMQTIHDTYHVPEWFRCLECIRRDYNLDPRVLHSFKGVELG